MHILLTGGTGFIGGALTKALIAAGHHCTILSRSARDDSEQLQYVCWSNCDDAALCKLVAEHDAIINLAGESVANGRWSTAKKARIRNSRIEITARLVRAIAHASQKPAVLINASAIGYYDSSLEIQSEDAMPGMGFLAQVVSAWEKTADQAKAYTRVVKLRIGLVFGPNGGPLHRMLPIFKLGLGGRLGPGTQWMSWIHRDDLIRMILTALTDERWQGAINAVSPHPLTNGDFTRTLAHVISRPALFPVPAWALRLALGEMSAMLLGSQRLSADKALNNGFHYNFESIQDTIAASS